MAPDDTDPAALDELVDRAGRAQVAVVGAGIAGLTGAWECAKLGMPVTVFEAADRAGGTLCTAMLDGVPVDVGADGFAARDPAVAGLLHDAGLAHALVAPRAAGRTVAGVPGLAGPAPLPQDAVLGIPENVWAEDVRRILGTSGTWRAYLDRVRPPMTIGHEHSLARLVRARMGDRVLTRLVAPLCTDVFFTDPGDVDVDVAAAGLNAALTRTGSLSGAVAALRAAPSGAGPGVQGVDGGMSRLADALAGRLHDRGARLCCGSPVSAVERADGGRGWIVHTDGDEFDVTDAPPARFDALLLAVPEDVARRLLRDILPGLPAPTGPAPERRVDTVAFVIDAPALTGRTGGAEALAVPGTHRAASVVHVNARWAGPDAALRAAGPDRHAVRVVFRPGPAPVGDEEALTALAVAEASALLGAPLEAAAVRAVRHARFAAPPPRALTGRIAAADRVRAAVAAVPRLAVTGAWLSGSGVAQVVPDAVTAARRLRRRTLFDGRSAV